MNDSITDEVRRIREEIAAEFDYDLERISAYMRRAQYAEGRQVVSFARERPSGTDSAS